MISVYSQQCRINQSKYKSSKFEVVAQMITVNMSPVFLFPPGYLSSTSHAQEAVASVPKLHTWRGYTYGDVCSFHCGSYANWASTGDKWHEQLCFRPLHRDEGFMQFILTQALKSTLLKPVQHLVGSNFSQI